MDAYIIVHQYMYTCPSPPIIGKQQQQQIAKRDECIKALRAGLQQLLGSKDEFVKVKK